MRTGPSNVPDPGRPLPQVFMNPYFDLSEPQPIADVETLLSLNAERRYYRPGDETPVTDLTNLYSFAHETAGIFRGQLLDWPLIPRCFRGLPEQQQELTGVARISAWVRATSAFRRFCERAEVQNPAFPSTVSGRMSIAQHFGIPTPLLDWSQNIFAAVFFAVRDVFADFSEFEKSGKVYIYHVADERLLHDGFPESEKLYDFASSAFVKPYHIDRRIERQRAVFTYHPHPGLRPPKVPARAYVLEWPLIERLIELMKGFGFTEDFYFPDYAGIARAVMSETSL